MSFISIPIQSYYPVARAARLARLTDVCPAAYVYSAYKLPAMVYLSGFRRERSSFINYVISVPIQSHHDARAARFARRTIVRIDHRNWFQFRKESTDPKSETHGIIVLHAVPVSSVLARMLNRNATMS